MPGYSIHLLSDWPVGSTAAWRAVSMGWAAGMAVGGLVHM